MTDAATSGSVLSGIYSAGPNYCLLIDKLRRTDDLKRPLLAVSGHSILQIPGRLNVRFGEKLSFGPSSD